MNKVILPIKIPMKDKHIELIKNGKKWYTLRSLKYTDHPYKKRKILIPDDLTDEIVEGAGYQSQEKLLKELKSMRHRFPKEMWLYDLREKEGE
jgi:hypothetical protein